MEIYWIKVSLIIIEALMQALITAVAIWIAYRLGQKQSLVDWKREIEQRKKEQREQRRFELIKTKFELDKEIRIKGLSMNNAVIGRNANEALTLKREMKVFGDLLINIDSFISELEAE